jgi:hypothetical protein
MHFTAILLVCSLPVASASCNEASAVDLISMGVASELGCTHGFQEMIARGGLRNGIGERFYIKTLCRRNGKQALATEP